VAGRADARARPPPLLGAVYLLLSLAPLIAAVALLCAGLRVEPLALVWTLVLLIAGGGCRWPACCSPR